MARQQPLALVALGVALIVTPVAGRGHAEHEREHCHTVSVHDGDTLTAQCPSGRIKVRLAEIDAPERTQPYARISTDALKALCVGKPTTVERYSIDKYGRTIARVYCGGVDVNARQVKTGLAWAFDRYLTDPSIKALESEAREKRRGLWRADHPEPPWEFRHH